jgi:hypothetical protein
MLLLVTLGTRVVFTFRFAVFVATTITIAVTKVACLATATLAINAIVIPAAAFIARDANVSPFDTLGGRIKCQLARWFQGSGGGECGELAPCRAINVRWRRNRVGTKLVNEPSRIARYASKATRNAILARLVVRSKANNTNQCVGQIINQGSTRVTYIDVVEMIRCNE